MKIHEYDSYDEYVEAQIKANKRKIDWQWVKKENIQIICDYIGQVDSVLCHGTRQGFEQKYFKQILECEVLGTEISPTAKDFEDTVQWDFNKQKKDWLNRWDIVYSNSLDHSPNPIETVDIWKQQAKKFVILERDENCNKSTVHDPFGATESEWEQMFPIKKKLKGEGTTIYIL